MSAQHFSQIPRAEIQRSSFDRSHGHKTTIDGGFLYPIFVDEALPGDTFNLKAHAIARLATPIFPIMDNIYLDTFFFAVPYRLLWDNWEKFNGSQDNPGDSTDFTIPKITGSVVAGSIGDYFGLPISAGVSASELPFRAYNLIWNEWFRDQNLQDRVLFTKADGGNQFNDYGLIRRGKRHDYFTSCLPWPQKGDAVTIPLGGNAPVVPRGITGTENIPTFKDNLASGSTTTYTLEAVSGQTAAQFEPSPSFTGIMGWQDPALIADLSSATAATINTLRQAFQIQKILERDARGGTRYTELIKSHFGVTSPDARLQRPEYLGGFSQPVNISQIAQTQRTDANATPLGTLGAVGTALLDGNRNGFTSSFTEHCVIIGLVSARAELTYQQRLDRMWSRSTRFDFYWPALAQIGEQAVLQKEVHHVGVPATDDLVFGYQERHAEYRYKPSMVTGLFRSNHPQSLDSWHLALDFGETPPLLNESFIQDNPPLDRVVAVTTEPKFLLDIWFELKTARPMPMYGVPGLIDHF